MKNRVFEATVLPLLAKPGTLSIVNYHRVFPKLDGMFPAEVYAERFTEHLLWLKSACNVLPLREANELRKSKRLPSRAVVITFDDGYADNAEVALPLLQKAEVPATFFVCSAYLNGGRMWNDTVIDSLRQMHPDDIESLQQIVPGVASLNLQQHVVGDGFDSAKVVGGVVQSFKYLPAEKRTKAVDDFAHLVGFNERPNLMMTPDQLRELRDAGMEIGGHTVNHPILGGLPFDEALQEVSGNKLWLEDVLGEPVTSFAYTNGKPGSDYTLETRKAVEQAGFDLAVTTAAGVSTQQSDSLQLPRFTPWDRSRQKFLTRLMLNTRKVDYDQV